MCGSSPNASYWSTGNWRTRAASSTDWCTNSPRPHRRKTRTRPPRASQSRRHRRPTRPSCYRCPASAPASSLVCLPRVATRCGGGTTPRFAVSAGWRRSPGVQEPARGAPPGCPRPAARRRLPLGSRRRPPRPGQPRQVSGAAQPRPWTRPLPALSGRPPAQRRLRHAPRRHLLRPAPCRKCHRVNSQHTPSIDIPHALASPMTKRLVGAVGTSSAACPRRGGRVFASTATAASMRHPVTSRPSRPPSRRRKKTLAKWWGVLFILPLPDSVVRSSSSHSRVAKKLSAIALSKQSPTEPIDSATPRSRQRAPKASEVYWQPWTLSYMSRARSRSRSLLAPSDRQHARVLAAVKAPRYVGLTALTTAPRTLGLALVGRRSILSPPMGPGCRGLAEVHRRRRLLTVTGSA